MAVVVSSMSPKERVLSAINHRESSQVPCDYWGTPEFDQLLIARFGVVSLDDALQKLGTDIRYIYGSGIIYEDRKGLYGPTTRYTGPERLRFSDGSFDDLWGCRRRLMQVASGNTYREIVQNPLRQMSTVAEIESYPNYPSAEHFDCTGLRAECDKWSDYALILGGVHGGSATVFHQCAYLRGLDQLLMDLILSPRMADALIAEVVEFQLAYFQRVLEEIGDLVDILMLADDYGTQSGLMMSPEHFRRFFRPPMLKLIELGKRHGLKIMLHSDGNIRKLIPDFIEMGIDVLNPIQNVGPEMDPADLKNEFGKDICFHGGVDTQLVLPFLSPGEVRKEVREKIEILGRGGGYILAPGHLVQRDVPLENILEFYRAPRALSGASCEE